MAHYPPDCILLMLSGFVPTLYLSTILCIRTCALHRAQKLNCTNAEHPDSYGHYREAKITAIKHHWWWKVSMSERVSYITASGLCTCFTRVQGSVQGGIPSVFHIGHVLHACKGQSTGNPSAFDIGHLQKGL